MNFKALRTVGKRVTDRISDCYSLIKEEVQLYYSENSSEDQDLKDRLKERSISSLLLRISLITLTTKAVYFFSQRGWLTGAISGLGFIFSILVTVWTNVLNLQSLVFPILSVVAMTTITWFTVFLDSFIPGVYPTNSLPSKKSSFYSTHIHLGYFVAVANGGILALLLYLGPSNETSK